MIRTSLHMNNK